MLNVGHRVRPFIFYISFCCVNAHSRCLSFKYWNNTTFPRRRNLTNRNLEICHNSILRVDIVAEDEPSVTRKGLVGDTECMESAEKHRKLRPLAVAIDVWQKCMTTALCLQRTVRTCNPGADYTFVPFGVITPDYPYVPFGDTVFYSAMVTFFMTEASGQVRDGDVIQSIRDGSPTAIYRCSHSGPGKSVDRW